MQRLVFWGIVILVFLLVFGIIGLICDQIFYRIIKLFLEKHTANMVRLITFIVVMITVITSVLVGHYITRLRVHINNIEIASDRVPKSFEGFKIAQISDFHIDSFDPEKEMFFVEEIVDKILAEKPDIICFTGDLVTIRSAQALPFRKALARLTSTGIPVYGIMGNHDYADYVREFDEARREKDRDSLRLIMREAGWRVLDNCSEKIYRGSDSILIAGVGNIGEPPFTTYGDLNTALQASAPVSDDDFTVLLSHNPTHWRDEIVPDTKIDLMLAGHTHAMQMKIFGWCPSKIKYKEYAGLYQEGKQFLYVNTGLGCTGPRIRIGVKPEISVINIARKGAKAQRRGF